MPAPNTTAAPEERRHQAAFRKSIVKDDGSKAVVFVASTADADRSDDIIDQASWKLANYSKNPVILLDHDYEVGKVVATGKAYLEDGALHLEVTKWASTARAIEAKALVDDDMVNAVSVGFRPGKATWRRNLASDHPAHQKEGYGLYFEDCELLEVSLVAVPANPNALAKASTALDPAQLEAMISKAIAAALSKDARAKADAAANAALDAPDAPATPAPTTKAVDPLADFFADDPLHTFMSQE